MAWQNIPGYTNYQCSPDGIVRSKWTKKILSTRPDPTGYPVVALSIRGKTKTFFLHRLVALTYLGSCPEGMTEVAHIDGNNQHNNRDNLRWSTHQENMDDQYAHGTRKRPSKTRDRIKAILKRSL